MVNTPATLRTGLYIHKSDAHSDANSDAKMSVQKSPDTACGFMHVKGHACHNQLL